MSHTPGRWEIFTHYDDDGDLTATVGRMMQNGASQQHVCKIYGWGNSFYRDEEQQSNSHLIAAAPDLLAALQQTVNALEVFHKERDGGEGLAYPMMTQARAAIAKATGK